MPVIPPIEQEFKNVHKYLEQSEIHHPLGYPVADYNTAPTKTLHGEMVWEQQLFLKPVIGFLSLSSSVSPSDGDRYIATGIGSTGDYGGASANDIIDYLTIDSYGQSYNKWDALPPSVGMLTYVSSLGGYYYYNGSDWLPLGTGSDVTTQSATVTFTGSNEDTYQDLYTNTGKQIDTVVYVADGLIPSDSSTFLGLVLHDGTPANDIEIVGNITTDELNSYRKTKVEINAIEIPVGFSLKLYVSGADITSGTIKVVTNYI